MCYLLIRRADAPHLTTVAAEGEPRVQQCYMRGDCISIREDDWENTDSEDTWKLNYIVHLPGVPKARMAYLLEEEYDDPDPVTVMVDGKRVTYTPKPRRIKCRKVQFDLSEFRKRLDSREILVMDAEDNKAAVCTETDVKALDSTRVRYRTLSMLES